MTRRVASFARAESGVATIALPMLLWVTLLVAVVLVDTAAYFVAAARAQTAADGAALAAVAADLTHGSPRQAAERVADHSGALLESCRCRRSVAHVVEVSVPVEGLVLPTLGAKRVSALATATSVHPTVEGQSNTTVR